MLPRLQSCHILMFSIPQRTPQVSETPKPSPLSPHTFLNGARAQLRAGVRRQAGGGALGRAGAGRGRGRGGARTRDRARSSPRGRPS